MSDTITTPDSSTGLTTVFSDIDVDPARLAALDAVSDEGYFDGEDEMVEEDDSAGVDMSDDESSIDAGKTAPAKKPEPQSAALRQAAQAVKAAKAEAEAAKAEAKALAALLAPLTEKLQAALAGKPNAQTPTDDSEDDYDTYEDPAEARIKQLEERLEAMLRQTEESKKLKAERSREAAIAAETAKLEQQWDAAVVEYPWLSDPMLAAVVMSAVEANQSLSFSDAAKAIQSRFAPAQSQTKAPKTFVPPVSKKSDPPVSGKKNISPLDAAAARLARMQIVGD